MRNDIGRGWNAVTLGVASMVMGQMVAKAKVANGNLLPLMSDVELSIRTILALPLFPAELPVNPRPLWAGIMFCPPAVDATDEDVKRCPGRYHPRFRAPYRISNREWMARMSKHLGLDLGDDDILNRHANGIPGPGLHEECAREEDERIPKLQGQVRRLLGISR